jgi:GntR family transcriptional regulator / MocR family aminotransferase
MPIRDSRTPLLSLAVDRQAGTALQIQIYNQVRDAILSGRLLPGAGLPATRTLAQDLVVSRNTVTGAFDRLMAEGYIEGKTGSGTRVSAVLPEDMLTTRRQGGNNMGAGLPAGKLSSLIRSLATKEIRSRHSEPGTHAFRPGLPALDDFPFHLWGRINARFWRHPPRDLLISGDLGGYLPLRRSIANYLGAMRGVNCSPAQIMVTSGAQQALDMISRALIDSGDNVWVENPGYAGMRATLTAAGAVLHHIPVDAEGLSVKTGRNRAPDAVMATVTPSHQFPLGVTMSLSRRLELLNWAAEANAWILEDDYDSEFRYGDKPLSALQGLDESGCVIYVGTFSKVLFPSLRLGYIVVPESLVSTFTELRAAIDDYPALALQPVLHAFFEEGHFASHIRRQRKLYAARQQTLLNALGQYADGLLRAAPHDAGMHLVAEIDPGVSLTDQEIYLRALDAGLDAPPLSGFFAGSVRKEGLILGYAGLTDKEIDRDVKRLVAVIRKPV